MGRAVAKVVAIGATGTLGQAVANELSTRHEVVKAAHKSGDFPVDTIPSADSIERLYGAVGDIGAVVCAAGAATSGTLDELGDEDYTLGLRNKLMGRLNLVRRRRHYIKDNGSFTLTCGVLGWKPTHGSVSDSTVTACVVFFAEKK